MNAKRLILPIVILVATTAAFAVGKPAAAPAAETDSQPDSFPLVIIAGNGQAQVISRQLPAPLQVRVLDASGSAPAGVAVRFKLLAAPDGARGWLLDALATTDSSGIAGANFLIGSQPGLYVIEAAVHDGTSDRATAVFKITGRRGDWKIALAMGLAGGLGLFLYGIGLLSRGMKKFSGPKLRKIITALTESRTRGILVGIFATIVFQSSSATTVMLVSLVDAGVLQFAKSLGVILGADIGTTVTTQLIAFKITDYALIGIAIGFLVIIVGKSDLTRAIGEGILGFGFVFFGIHLMSGAMQPLQTFQPLIQLLQRLENPLLGLLLGAVFTAVIQSSAAFTGIIIVLASHGILTLEAGIPLLFGANIGTTVTAGLASLNAGREAKKVALAHTMFKIGGVALFLFWIPAFADFIRLISPAPATLTGDIFSHYAAVPRQIANAHTIFNVSLAVIFLPFTGFISRYLDRIIPPAPRLHGIQPVTVHLDNSLLSTPDLALKLARAEIREIGGMTLEMMQNIIVPFIEPEKSKDVVYPQISLMKGLKLREEKVDFLDEQVSGYLYELSRESLTARQVNEIYALVYIARDLEAIGDIIDKTMVPLAVKKLSLDLDFSAEGKEELSAYHLQAIKQLSRSMAAIKSLNREQAQKILLKGARYFGLGDEFKRTHFDRVRKAVSESMVTDEVHVELLLQLEKINSHTSSIARAIMELRSSDS